VLSVVAAAAAFLLAALLSLSSVGKRVRELGTLKALGWTQSRVVRQVASESLAQGVLGGVAGVALGLLAIVAIDALGPTLSASSTTGGGDIFGIQQAAHTTARAVSLTAPVGVTILLVGFGLALLGGLLAGAAGALRAARLRPTDALRTLE
jgi:ABC-type lipoprotein release transport system permease subunit